MDRRDGGRLGRGGSYWCAWLSLGFPALSDYFPCYPSVDGFELIDLWTRALFANEQVVEVSALVAFALSNSLGTWGEQVGTCLVQTLFMHSHLTLSAL